MGMWRGQMIDSLRPQVVFGMALPPSFCHHFGGKFIFRGPNVVEQFVEGFGTEFLP
jgi:hypothetical protein